MRQVVESPVLERGDLQLDYSGDCVVVSLFLVDYSGIADDYALALKFLYSCCDLLLGNAEHGGKLRVGKPRVLL